MEDEIKTHSAKSCSLPQNIAQSITDDIKDVLSTISLPRRLWKMPRSYSTRSLLHTAAISVCYQCSFAAVPISNCRIEPSLTRFTNVPNPLSSPKLIRRVEPLSSEYERQHTLKSMSEAERESLLSESVQIEVCVCFARWMVVEIAGTRVGRGEVAVDWRLNCRNVEKNAREVSQMVKEFTMNVVDQHEMVELVHRNVEKAKDYVDDVRKRDVWWWCVGTERFEESGREQSRIHALGKSDDFCFRHPSVYTCLRGAFLLRRSISRCFLVLRLYVCGLWTVDYGLWTVDCELWFACLFHQTEHIKKLCPSQYFIKSITCRM